MGADLFRAANVLTRAARLIPQVASETLYLVFGTLAAVPPEVMQQVNKALRPKRRQEGPSLVLALVEEYRPLVRRAAHYLKHRLPRSVEQADLEQAGTAGLIQAAPRFRAESGASFKTFHLAPRYGRDD